MNRDWAFLQAAVKELEEYVTSPVLHWPLAKSVAGSDLPRLTLGNLCLALARAKADPDVQADPQFKTLQGTVDQVRNRWRSNWAKKAGQEFRERLRLWKDFVTADLAGEGENRDYQNQVRQRVVLEFLKDEMLPENPPEAELLLTLDERLRYATSEGDFVWDSKWQTAFPQNRFWFLYRKFS